MEKIPKTFTKFNETFTLIKRKGNIVMYKRDSGYEIHKVRVQKPYTRTFPDGRTISLKEKEYLANDNDFSYYAWFLPNLRTANIEFEEQMVKAHQRHLKRLPKK